MEARTEGRERVTLRRGKGRGAAGSRIYRRMDPVWHFYNHHILSGSSRNFNSLRDNYICSSSYIHRYISPTTHHQLCSQLYYEESSRPKLVPRLARARPALDALIYLQHRSELPLVQLGHYYQLPVPQHHHNLQRYHDRSRFFLRAYRRYLHRPENV